MPPFLTLRFRLMFLLMGAFLAFSLACMLSLWVVIAFSLAFYAYAPELVQWLSEGAPDQEPGDNDYDPLS